ncbi:MAG: MerR family transcriptional regulator [Chloroflexota bacterium]
MTVPFLTTSDITKAVGVHVNTVRLYEEWGFLPPVTRAANGYRQFTQRHLNQIRLTRLALVGPYPGSKQPVLDLVRCGAAGDLGGALEHAYHYLAQIRAERVRAETATMLLEHWLKGATISATHQPLTIKQAAKLVGMHMDTLRSWERNGLLTIPRHPDNQYRQYGANEIARIRVIRMLRDAGYSTMTILRLIQHIDQHGSDIDVWRILNTPTPQEEVFSASDQYMTTIAAQEQRALDIIKLIETQISQA